MAKEQSTSTSDVDFALKLYQKLSGDEQGNLFISPYSISTALAMVLLGTKENTAQEIKESLQVGALDDVDIHLKNMSTLEELLQVNGITLETASKLFPEKSFPVRKQYFDNSQKYYKATTEPLNYIENAEESRNAINKWVEEQTKSKVKDLLPSGSVTSDSKLVLANAIYFKGNWLDQFKESATTEMDFFVNENRNEKLQMIMQQRNYNFSSDVDLDVNAVEIPYKNKDFSMLILLPNQKSGIAALEKNLSASKLRKLTSDLYATDVILGLPRMKVEFKVNLIPHLQNLGVKDLFDPSKANMTGLSEAEGLFVSTVFHKAVIEVNEEGSEAAAATELEEEFSDPPPQEVMCDHPFMFLIRHIPTSSILFAGRFASP